MKIEATQEPIPPLLHAAVGQGGTDFQAALAAAKQHLAEASHSPPVKPADDTGKQVPAQRQTDADFLADYVTKTPAQHMRDRILQMREEILKKMGLSEAALAAMPPDQREAIEKMVMAEIRKRLFGQGDNAEKNQPNQINQFAVLSSRAPQNEVLQIKNETP